MVLMINLDMKSIRNFCYAICWNSYISSSRCSVEICRNSRTIKELDSSCSTNYKVSLNIVQNQLSCDSDSCNCESNVSANTCNTNSSYSDNITNLITISSRSNSCTNCNAIFNGNISSCICTSS